MDILEKNKLLTDVLKDLRTNVIHLETHFTESEVNGKDYSFRVGFDKKMEKKEVLYVVKKHFDKEELSYFNLQDVFDDETDDEGDYTGVSTYLLTQLYFSIRA